MSKVCAQEAPPKTMQLKIAMPIIFFTGPPTQHGCGSSYTRKRRSIENAGKHREICRSGGRAVSSSADMRYADTASGTRGTHLLLLVPCGKRWQSERLARKTPHRNWESKLLRKLCCGRVPPFVRSSGPLS